jgi:hypothetical protein
MLHVDNARREPFEAEKYRGRFASHRLSQAGCANRLHHGLADQERALNPPVTPGRRSKLRGSRVRELERGTSQIVPWFPSTSTERISKIRDILVVFAPPTFEFHVAVWARRSAT